jgi:hypothetical protein
MVIGLQSRAELSLGEDDEGVEDLVELAKIEDPAIVSQALVPETTRLCATGKAIDDGGMLRDSNKCARGLVVVDRVSKTLRAVKAAEAVSGTGKTLRTHWVQDAPPHATEHAPESPCRVDGEKDIVEDDKDVEGTGLADCPGLLAVRLVVDVEALDSDGVEGSNGQGDLGVESSCVDVPRDVEWAQDGCGNVDRRDWGRRVCGRKAEEAGIGRRTQQVKMLGHGDG